MVVSWDDCVLYIVYHILAYLSRTDMPIFEKIFRFGKKFYILFTRGFRCSAII